MATSSTSPKLAVGAAGLEAAGYEVAARAGSSGSGQAPRVRHKFWLRLTDQWETKKVDLPLFGGYRSSGLDLEGAGVVHGSHGYDACILTTAELVPGETQWQLNDDDPVTLTLSAPFPMPVEGPDGEDCLLYQLLPGDDDVEIFEDRGRRTPMWRPFKLLYGFARIEVELPGLGLPTPEGQLASPSQPAESGQLAAPSQPPAPRRPIELSTRDVACVCDSSDQEIPVAEMVRELVNAPDAEVVGWMLGKAGGEAERRSLVESSPVTDSSESLASYLTLCERVLRAYERNLAFFCRHAYSRTVKTDVLLAPSQVRRAGRRELLWLASNPDMLHKTSSTTAVRLGGESYTVSQLRTERPTLTFDNRENRALLAFADEVAASLTDIAARAQEEAAKLREMGDRLRGLVEGDGIIPSLLVIDACLSREEPLIERAQELRRRARKVAATLARELPQVERVRYRLPKRTKPFQEIPAYVELYALMRSWDAFGEFALERDGLVLHTWRMDKLYEYYLLYLLLSTLRSLGFEPDPSVDESVRMARYSLSSHVYANEEQVAGVYRLARSDDSLAAEKELAEMMEAEEDAPWNEEEAAESVAPIRVMPKKVTLYYQPVFYADGREEYGVDLHRTTSSTRHPYWTPDYLLVLDTPDGRRQRLILDAKFRRFGDVLPDNSNKESQEKISPLLDCLRKYTLETAGPRGVRPDSVWLLCGRAKRRAFWAERLSDWAREQGVLPNGVATAVPGANALDDVLAAVGIICAPELAAELAVDERAAEDLSEVAWTVGDEEAGRESAKAAVDEGEIAGAEALAEGREVVEVSEPAEKGDEDTSLVESALVDESLQQGDAEDSAGDIAESSDASDAVSDTPAVSSDDSVLAEDNQPQPPAPQPAKPTKPPKQPKQPKRQKQPRGDSNKSKQTARPDAPVVDEALLSEVTNLLRALIDRGFKHEHLQKIIGRACKISHPLIRDRKPEGREARFYSADPVEIGGEPWYVFIDWKPNTLALLRKY